MSSSSEGVESDGGDEKDPMALLKNLMKEHGPLAMIGGGLALVLASSVGYSTKIINMLKNPTISNISDQFKNMTKDGKDPKDGGGAGNPMDKLKGKLKMFSDKAGEGGKGKGEMANKLKQFLDKDKGAEKLDKSESGQGKPGKKGRENSLTHKVSIEDPSDQSSDFDGSMESYPEVHKMTPINKPPREGSTNPKGGDSDRNGRLEGRGREASEFTTSPLIHSQNGGKQEMKRIESIMNNPEQLKNIGSLVEKKEELQKLENIVQNPAQLQRLETLIKNPEQLESLGVLMQKQNEFYQIQSMYPENAPKVNQFQNPGGIPTQNFQSGMGMTQGPGFGNSRRQSATGGFQIGRQQYDQIDSEFNMAHGMGPGYAQNASQIQLLSPVPPPMGVQEQNFQPIPGSSHGQVSDFENIRLQSSAGGFPVGRQQDGQMNSDTSNMGQGLNRMDPGHAQNASQIRMTSPVPTPGLVGNEVLMRRGSTIPNYSNQFLNDQAYMHRASPAPTASMQFVNDPQLRRSSEVPTALPVQFTNEIPRVHAAPLPASLAPQWNDSPMSRPASMQPNPVHMPVGSRPVSPMTMTNGGNDARMRRGAMQPNPMQTPLGNGPQAQIRISPMSTTNGVQGNGAHMRRTGSAQANPTQTLLGSGPQPQRMSSMPMRNDPMSPRFEKEEHFDKDEAFANLDRILETFEQKEPYEAFDTIRQMETNSNQNKRNRGSNVGELVDGGAPGHIATVAKEMAKYPAGAKPLSGLKKREASPSRFASPPTTSASQGQGQGVGIGVQNKFNDSRGSDAGLVNSHSGSEFLAPPPTRRSPLPLLVVTSPSGYSNGPNGDRDRSLASASDSNPLPRGAFHPYNPNAQDEYWDGESQNGRSRHQTSFNGHDTGHMSGGQQNSDFPREFRNHL